MMQNDVATCQQIDTDLTRGRSPDVHALVLPDLPFDITTARRRAYAEREAVGALTMRGRMCSKFGEQLENFAKATTMEQALGLRDLLIDTADRLKIRVRVAAVSHPKGDQA